MHFPEGKNDSADARRLFGDWRTSLLKKGTPGPRVLVTHGQSSTHWISDDQGRLCIDLEDMWGDFEHAAECRRLDQIAIAVALGHPIGASCSRILSTMIYELRRSGGGQGDAVLLEV